jgi:hypothetical protein
MITQSPFETDFMFEPTDTTSKQPSLPPTALGAEVPRRDVKGGLAGYTPCIWFMSAGLIGLARVRRRTALDGREGEIE